MLSNRTQTWRALSILGFDLDKSEEQPDKLTSSEICIELKNNLFKTCSPPSLFFTKEMKDEVMDIWSLITYYKAFKFLRSFLTHRQNPATAATDNILQFPN